MLDRDIDTAAALAHLSTRDDDPAGWTRRRFLQAVACGLGGGAVLSAADAALVPTLLPDRLRDAWSAPPVGPADGILVVILMYGGNDGLNTLVPYTNGSYYSMRGALAVPAAQVLPIDGNVGLHPNLSFVKSQYDLGNVAIVQGVGYPNPDLSHFTSMGIWMHGRNSSGVGSTGWLGRYLDGLGGQVDAFSAAQIGASVPLHMVGAARRATAIPEWGGGFGTGAEAWERRLYDGLRQYSAASAGRGVLHDGAALATRTQIDVAQTVDPLFSPALPDGDLAKQLVLTARLINANLGLRVVSVGWGDFDTHDNQPAEHPVKLAELDEALRLFFVNLDSTYQSRVTVLTMSEFGRTPYANGSAGTDHGTASCQFLIGPAVNGGLHGQQPSLAGLGRWDDLPHTVDFRSVYATVLESWLAADANSILGGAYGRLPLFRNAPGVGVPITPSPPAMFGDYVPLTPARILDTRDGTGGRSVPLGHGTTHSFAVTGVGGVPASDVTAVAMNVVVTEPSGSGYFTVWPTGEPRPYTASLNFTPGTTAPNLVVMKPGAGGQVSIFNFAGTAHAVGDVVGYFRGSSASKLLPLSPFRLLDTRDGTGGTSGKVGQQQTIELAVTGVPGSGVPGSGVDAVVLNLVATEPTAPSFLTLHPSGVARPLAATLNFAAGETRSNLTVAKVGAGGRVSIFNNTGATHVVADVVGCFTGATTSRHKPHGPVRILDTREGLGIAGPLRAGVPAQLGVAGVQGIPAGATAVVINLTVTDPSGSGFLTAYPAGEPLPLAANLNYTTGQTIPNLAIVKLGGGGINLYATAALTHVVGDVVGFFEG